MTHMKMENVQITMHSKYMYNIVLSGGDEASETHRQKAADKATNSDSRHSVMHVSSRSGFLLARAKQPDGSSGQNEDKLEI